MHSAIKSISNGTLVGPALTVKLSTGDLVDCLDALPLAQPNDVIVVDAGGETETSVWGTVPGNQLEEILKLAKEQAEREEGTRKQIAAGKTVDELLEEFGRI